MFFLKAFQLSSENTCYFNNTEIDSILDALVKVLLSKLGFYFYYEKINQLPNLLFLIFKRRQPRWLSHASQLIKRNFLIFCYLLCYISETVIYNFSKISDRIQLKFPNRVFRLVICASKLGNRFTLHKRPNKRNQAQKIRRCILRINFNFLMKLFLFPNKMIRLTK